jgi:hypothetical protein
MSRIEAGLAFDPPALSLTPKLGVGFLGGRLSGYFIRYFPDSQSEGTQAQLDHLKKGASLISEALAAYRANGYLLLERLANNKNLPEQLAMHRDNLTALYRYADKLTDHLLLGEDERPPYPDRPPLR